MVQAWTHKPETEPMQWEHSGFTIQATHGGFLVRGKGGSVIVECDTAQDAETIAETLAERGIQ